MRHWRAGVAIANARGRAPKTSKPDPRECSEGSQESPRTRRTTQDMTAPSVELTARARARALVLCSLRRAVPARQYRAGAVCCILASFLWPPCVPGPSAYARPARRLACMLSSMPAGCANNISWRAARRIVTRLGRASGIERRDWSSERSRRQVWMLAMLAGDLRSLAQLRSLLASSVASRRTHLRVFSSRMSRACPLITYALGSWLALQRSAGSGRRIAGEEGWRSRRGTSEPKLGDRSSVPDPVPAAVPSGDPVPSTKPDRMIAS